MKELIETLTAWEAEGHEAGRAVVVRTFGSAPRPEGAVLLVSDDGRLAGSVSGGCVEGAAFEEIERARRDGMARVIRYGISDEQAWDVGLACGGTIDVLVEPLVRPEAEAAAREAATEGGRAMVTPLPGTRRRPEFGPHQPGDGAAPAPVAHRPRRGRLDGTLGDETARRRADPPRPGGAGRRHLADGRDRRPASCSSRPSAPAAARDRRRGPGRDPARAIAKQLGTRRSWSMAGRRSPRASVSRTRIRWSSAGRTRSPSRSAWASDAVAVLTHDVKFDEPAIVDALRRRARYVGAVGRARPRPTGASDCARPVSPTRSSPSSAGRSGSTSGSVARRDGARDHGRGRRGATRCLRRPDAREGPGRGGGDGRGVSAADDPARTGEVLRRAAELAIEFRDDLPDRPLTPPPAPTRCSESCVHR